MPSITVRLPARQRQEPKGCYRQAKGPSLIGSRSPKDLPDRDRGQPKGPGLIRHYRTGVILPGRR
ncbi:MAG TPA: hypothetical protein DHU96_08990 [Actinobacteria bacterium]|nr:hypothetical protein [Actinomycetota bacterium]